VQDRQPNATERVESSGADGARRRRPLLPRELERETAVSDGSRRRAGDAASRGSGVAASGGRLVLREVNDRIAGLIEGWNETGVSLFVCECSNRGCAEALELTAAEYERIRADESHFLVFPGHERESSGRVVERTGRFVIVANADPDGAQARAGDVRPEG
jgi:hypothetical protein